MYIGRCIMVDNIISEIIDIINEEFYLLDIDFNSDYCEPLFREIHSAFVSAKKDDKFHVEILNFVKKCLQKVERDREYDYHLFLNNIHLLPLSFLKREKIISNFEKQIAIRKIS